jgi:hypothetical protein
VDHDIRKPLAFERKDNILVLHIFGPAEPSKLIGTPFVQKAQDGLQSFVRRETKPFAMRDDKCFVFS